jgi:MinD superfamily P-loop ATPase
MKIAVLSGKGGTGKTFVAVNLASAIAKSIYLDCDVEEPNGHLFFTPQNIEKEE